MNNYYIQKKQKVLNNLNIKSNFLFYENEIKQQYLPFTTQYHKR